MHLKNVVSLFFVSSFAITCVTVTNNFFTFNDLAYLTYRNIYIETYTYHAGRKSRIVNGDVAELGQFPYAVAIIQFERGYVCGGGIIGDKWILSAAHCVTDHVENDPFRDDDFSIIAGTNNIENDYDSNVGFEILVEAIYVPRDFNLTIRRADIAVLKLAQTLDFQKYHLQQLSLPLENQNYYDVETNAVVTGFGAKNVEFTINGNEKELTDFDIDGKLRYANVTIVSDSEFAKIPHDDYDLGEYHFLAKMMKQSDSSYGMCFGDSGSPVVYQSKIIIGVTIEMFDMCDEREYPSLYTKVIHYLNFIRNAMNDVVTEDIRVKRY